MTDPGEVILSVLIFIIFLLIGFILSQKIDS
jgi:hypothetical protein